MPTIRHPLWRCSVIAVLTALINPAANAALEPPASGGSAYRCTDAQGRVSYTQQACATGMADPAGANGKLMSFLDERTDAQRAQAHKALQRDEVLARDMSRQSRHRSNREEHLEAGSLSGPVRQVSVGQREVRRPGDTIKPTRRKAAGFRAMVPNTARRKSTAQAGVPAM